VPTAIIAIKLATVFIGICTAADSDIVKGFLLDMWTSAESQDS
jgi:hypothetical protein